MTTIPRPRQTQDHEMRILSHILDLLATLEPVSRRRVAEYALARIDDLKTVAEVHGNSDATVELFPAIEATGG